MKLHTPDVLHSAWTDGFTPFSRSLAPERTIGRCRKCVQRSRPQRLERETGLEPATSTLARWHSTTELLPQVVMERFRIDWNVYSDAPSLSSVFSFRPHPCGQH